MEFSVSTSWTLLSENDKDGILRNHDDSDVNFENHWSAKKSWYVIANCMTSLQHLSHSMNISVRPIQNHFKPIKTQTWNVSLSHLGWAIIKLEEMSTKIGYWISFTFVLTFWKLFVSFLRKSYISFLGGPKTLGIFNFC